MKFVIVLVAVLAVAVAKPQYFGAPVSNTAAQNSNAAANGPGATAISKGTANANMAAPAAPLYPPGPYPPGPYPPGPYPPGPYPPRPIYPGPVSNNAQQNSNAVANGPGGTAISDGTANANMG